MLDKKISNTIRKSAHKLLETKVMISVILLAILSIASLTYLPIYAATPPEPPYGTANVDGNSGEWVLATDFWSNMYLAGNPSNAILSKAYLRYDCTASVLYVLVLAQSGITIAASETNEHWVDIDGDGKEVSDQSGDDGTAPDFQFIVVSTDTIGWEASLPLTAGTYTIQIHTNVLQSPTAGSSDTSATIVLDLFICCGGTTTTVTTTDTTTETFTDCTTTIATSTETTTATTTATETFTDCTTTIATSTETTTETTTITSTEDCYTGDGGISNFGKIVCEGPNVIVGETEIPEIWRGAAGTQPADWIDATAAALLWGLCEDGELYWDHDPTEVNQATGQTILPGHEIMSGGPLVNAPVKYYEGLKLAPVYYKASGGYATFFDSTTDTQISGAQLLGSEIGPSKDMFVIMILQKPGTELDPEYSIMAYGFAGRGTLASSVYFKTVIEPDLSSYTMDWIIVQWEDTNGNFHPDIPGTDTYTVIAIAP